MKRQLDRLKGKRLVTGDPNLMTKDEICINATPNGVEVKEIGTDGKIKDLAGSGNNGGVMEVEYLYIKGPAFTAYKAIGVVGAVGKYSMGTASVPNTFTAFSAGGNYAAIIKGFKLVKGLFKENNTIYDTTTFNKFIETYELDPSSYEEITKEYYENIENWK